MSTNDRLVQLLSADATLVALIGGARFYFQQAPREVPKPYVIYTIISGGGVTTQDEPQMGTRKRIYSFKAIAQSPVPAVAAATLSLSIAARVKAVLSEVNERPGIQSIVPIMGPVPMPYLDTEKVYTVVEDYELWSDLD